MNFAIIKNAFNVGKNVLVKNSPKILLALGIGSGIGATVSGCIAMTKTPPILANHKEKIDKIHEKKGELAENEYNRTVTKEYLRYSLDLGKVWSPCAFLTFASIACTLGCYGIMNKRLSAVTSAFALISSKFDNYRENVIADVGEEKDKLYISNGVLKNKKALENKTSKKELVSTVSNVASTSNVDSIFRYAYNEDNVQKGCYSTATGYNFQFLCSKQEFFQWQLEKNGFVLLTDVFQACGLSCHKLWEEMKEGRIYGWTLDDCSETIYNDSHVLFDIWENNDISHRLFRMGQINDVILNFNCRLFTQETLDLLATKGCYF